MRRNMQTAVGIMSDAKDSMNLAREFNRLSGPPGRAR